MTKLKLAPAQGIALQHDRAIDFCCWVLELDGLKFAPFDQHREGSSILRNAGLDQESWQQWLVTVVNLQRPILRSKTLLDSDLKQQDWVERELAQTKKLFSDVERHPSMQGLEFSEDDIRFALWERVSQSQQRHLEAVSKLPKFEEDFKNYIDRPDKAWIGTPEIRSILLDLWNHYDQNLIGARRNKQTHYAKLIDSAEHPWTELEAYQADLPCVSVWFVDYPASVEYFVPPDSIILKTDLTDGDRLVRLIAGVLTNSFFNQRNTL
jgi:hypothetical protein